MFPPSGPLQASANQTTLVNLDSYYYPNKYGGSAALSWTYLQKTYTFNFLICGENPLPSDVDSYFASATSSAGNSYWFGRNISIHETGQHQFWAPGDPATCNTVPLSDRTTAGFPLCGTPSGYGLMQLDPAASANQLWDWTQNIVGGLDKLDLIAYPDQNIGYNFWGRQVDQWITYNRNQELRGLPTVPPPPDDVSVPGVCTFTFGSAPYTAPNPAPGVYWYGDAVVMKDYGGTTNGNYISFDLNSGTWKFIRSNQSGRNYAYEFCTCSSPGLSCRHSTP